MKILLVTLIGPLLLGLSVLVLLGFRGTRSLAGWLLIGSWSIAVGIASSSLLFFLISQLSTVTAASLLLTEVGVGTLCVVMAPFFHLTFPTLLPAGRIGAPDWRGAERWSAVASGGIVLSSFVYVVLHSLRFPEGGMDAIAFWNLRARLLYLDPGGWERVFALLGYFRPDHPVMLTTFIARSWFLIGEEARSVYVLVALLSTTATVGVMYAGISLLRNGLVANLSVALLFIPTSVLGNAALLMSDLPFTLFVTSAGISLLLASKEDGGRDSRYLPTGLFLGMAIWTKNEGLVWMLAFLGSLLLRGLIWGRFREDLRICGVLILGGLPFAASLFWYKGLVPFEEIRCLVPAFPVSGLLNLFNLRRDLEILFLMLKGGFEFGGFFLILFPLVLYLGGVSKSLQTLERVAPLIGVLILASMGYVAAYVATPNPVDFQIGYSIYRVATHLWPTAVLVGLMVSNLGFAGRADFGGELKIKGDQQTG